VKKFVVSLAVLGLLAVAGLARAQPGGPPGGFGGPPGGPGGPPQPGQVLPGFLQEMLNLTAEQKKQVEELQKEVDAKLAKILTAEQKKTLQQMPGPFSFPGGPGGGGFGPPGPGGFSRPPGFGGGFAQTSRLDDVKKQIGASDEEWKVIGPKLQKVLAARQALTADAQGAGPGFGVPPFGGGAPPSGETRPGEAAGGAGGPPAGFGPPPGVGFGGPMATNAISQAQAELKTLLNDPKHSAAEVKEKVAAVRKARQKARGDVEAAQKDLLLMLTADQEAMLVSLGYIE
jgi:Spy/CpxP family protein refolding chaperone